MIRTYYIKLQKLIISYSNDVLPQENLYKSSLNLLKFDTVFDILEGSGIIPPVIVVLLLSLKRILEVYFGNKPL